MNTSYQKLESRFLQIARLESARGILQWDEAVMMPSGASDFRNQSMAELALVVQNLSTGTEIGDWLGDAKTRIHDLNDWQRANLREMERIYTEATAIPPELTQKLVMARMNAEQKWRTLRGQNDWRTFQPILQELLTLTRESLQILSKLRGLSVYDTALAMYSPGLTTAVVEKLFGEIKGFLPEMIRQVSERQKQDQIIPAKGHYPMAAQKALGHDLMAAIGFSFDLGRLDESHHPFCGGGVRDVRITTRYQDSDFVPAMMGVLHETGHAMYEQNLPKSWMGQPVGSAAGMAMHESQSLFWEMQICRSPEFLSFAAPLIRKHLGTFAEDARALGDQNLAALVTRSKPGYIRVNADEVTYPAHVILRFELERQMLEGQLALQDLPEAWNERMTSYLGLSTRGNDKDGCMQDVHWPAGLFGYFPAYTFGAVIAAQLFAKLQEEVPNVRSLIANGEFQPIRDWLNKKVWSEGAKQPTLDLVSQATGELSAKPFHQHLKTRYLGA